MKKQNIIRVVLITAAILLTLTVSTMACNKPLDGMPENDAIETSSDSLSTEEPIPEETEPTRPSVPIVSRQEQLAEAKKANRDTVAWLYLPGTAIDDPVVQADDNNYYLKRTFEGEYSVWGCYFADYLNTLDSREKLDANTVIYGHAYKNEDPDERKFTQLFHYLDKDFIEENPYIYLSLDGEDLAFQVCAVFFTDISFDYINPNPPADFYDTVTAKNEFVFEGLTFGADDRILTLSTCSHRYDTQNTGNHRLAVMAKLLPGDAAEQTVTVTTNPNPERP